MMTYRVTTDERRPRLFGIEPLKLFRVRSLLSIKVSVSYFYVVDSFAFDEVHNVSLSYERTRMYTTNVKITLKILQFTIHICTIACMVWHHSTVHSFFYKLERQYQKVYSNSRTHYSTGSTHAFIGYRS